MCVHVHMCMYVNETANMWSSEDNLVKLELSLPTMWVPRINLGSQTQQQTMLGHLDWTSTLIFFFLQSKI